MMPTLDSEQIMALAPDASAAKAGKDQANPQKWPTLGHNAQAVWGECQGSSATPYQTMVDLSEIAYHCTCPSRKFPCKHTLGLLLLLHEQPAAFTETIPLERVTVWLAKRAQQREQRSATATAPPTETADPTAQAKRASERYARTAAGLQDLELWLRDLMRQGLVSARSQPPTFWHTPAARMVDAQAPGVARRLRQMHTALHAGADWSEQLLDQIGRLHLLIEGFKRFETLPAPVQADITNVLGWTVRQDDLLTEAGVRDTWLVTGQRVETEEKLQSQFTWLWGCTTQRSALVLDFAFGNTPLDKSLVPDTCLDAELVFFPGNYPLRAFVKVRHTTTTSPNKRPGYPTIAAALDAYSTAVAAFPWLERFPMLLNDVVPAVQATHWLVCDQLQRCLPCAPNGAPYWRLLARSGGHSMDIFGEWDGQSFWPLGAWDVPH
ncbi:MAG: SWIM zinc finger family protein [Chloroflexaceae bacterium]|nr:SWIM zinc finger family protein [Chloroflexaceae bacterium]NJO06691.1 SWIM zinc finger family protein [Chloroflexaceae bacterium]